jgi:GNAT superfamily N-acetyltransferase
VRIVEAWAPGVIGGIAALHARFYAESHGFGAFFEAKVARELGEFLGRMDAARGDLFRCALAADGRVLGSIALDAGDPSPEGLWHLRWFILDAALRGQGLGRAWLAACIDSARRHGAPGIHLWTLAGLDAAARAYAASGFVVTEQVAATQWGRETAEIRMELRLSG